MIVSKDYNERAEERITEYYMELHPELQVTNELIPRGKCPARGSSVRHNDSECYDCGLTLVIVGNKDPEERG